MVALPVMALVGGVSFGVVMNRPFVLAFDAIAIGAAAVLLLATWTLMRLQWLSYLSSALLTLALTGSLFLSHAVALFVGYSAQDPDASLLDASFVYFPMYFVLLTILLPYPRSALYGVAAWLAFATLTTGLALPFWRDSPSPEGLLAVLSVVWIGYPMFLILVIGSGKGHFRMVRLYAAEATKARAAQAQAEEGAVRLKAVFNQAAVGIGLLDSKCRWLQVNQRICEMTGYTAAELMALDFRSTTHPEDFKVELVELNKVARHELDSYSMETRTFRKDGDMIWNKVYVSRLTDPATRSDYYVVALVDISKRKAAEDKLAMLNGELEQRIEARTRDLQQANLELMALNEANQISAAVIESSAEGVMVTDAQLRIESVNPAFEHITGYAAAEVVGQSPKMLVSGKHDEAFFHRLRDTVDAQGHWRGEIWNRRQNGTVYPQETSVSVLRDAGGHVRHYASVFSDNTTQNQLEAKLRELSSLDGLTGIANRRSFDEVLAREWARALRDHAALSLLMIDIDFFKNYNDRHGHLQGDQCLQQVAQAFSGAANRASDVVARYGGEEFAMILPGTDAAAAARMAEKVRAAVAALALPHGGSDAAAFVTVSVGAATLIPAPASLQVELIAAADRALFQAKDSGRNRVASAAAPRAAGARMRAPQHSALVAVRR